MTREEQLELQVDALKTDLLHYAAKEIRFGDAYRHQFFIPEDLGFQEEELLDPDLERDGVYSVMGSFYIKDGYAIARGDDNYWIVSAPSRQIKNKLMFNSMYDAVIGLRMSGMDVSFETIRQNARKVVEGITDMIEEELPAIRAEREQLKLSEASKYRQIKSYNTETGEMNVFVFVPENISDISQINPLNVLAKTEVATIRGWYEDGIYKGPLPKEVEEIMNEVQNEKLLVLDVIQK